MQAMKAAEKMHDHLSRLVYPSLTVGLLHGKLTPHEKEIAMEKFQRGEIQILVATTVIEVGVDVPNATVMLIEQAERFGLAQVSSQLRGRVGRGAEQSYCILVTDKLNPASRERIRTLVESNDGFYIAEMDMKLRGPGEFFGTKQSGFLSYFVSATFYATRIFWKWPAVRLRRLWRIHAAEDDLRRAVAFIREHWQRIRTGSGRLKVRVIGGEFRSRVLKSVPGLDVRPTPDRLREALFSILTPRIEGAVFADIYAGTGSVGIEALSRGAAKAIFVETNRAALGVIRENLRSLGLEARSVVLQLRATRIVPSMYGDIAFVDPPYSLEREYSEMLDLLGATPPDSRSCSTTFG